MARNEPAKSERGGSYQRPDGMIQLRAGEAFVTERGRFVEMATPFCGQPRNEEILARQME